MKENRYILPEDKSCNMVSEPLIATSQLSDLKTQVVERVMNIQNTETLQSLIVYIDQNVLPKTDNFEEDWKRTSEGRATTVGRAADSRGTLVPLQWHARLTPATVPTEL